MAEDYAAKMDRKTDAELLLYVRNCTEYREEAILAALDEVERRQLVVPGLDAAAIRSEIGPIVAEQRALEARQQAQVTATEQEAEAPGPVLYSPVTITLFSVFFSMLAGGTLLALNFRTLGRTSAIWRLIAFIIGYLVLWVGVALFVFTTPALKSGLWFVLLFAEIPAVIAYNLWFWPRYVGVYQFKSRGWLVPFLICTALRVGLGLLLLPLIQTQLEAIGALPG